jgi:alpha-mannosidase
MVLPTPDAQCLGTHTLEYALLPHEGDSDAGLLSKHAAEYDAPPLAVQNRIHSQGMLRRENLIAQFIEIENLCMHLQQQLQPIQTGDHTLFSIDKEEILVSALKKAEAEEALILRIYNTTAQDVKDVHITFSPDIKKAYSTNFAEKKEQELDIHDQHTLVLDTLKPYSAATILLLF